jgi:hypothetical protein
MHISRMQALRQVLYAFTSMIVLCRYYYYYYYYYIFL